MNEIKPIDFSNFNYLINSCAKCPANISCSHFAKVFDKIKKEIDEEVLLKKKSIAVSGQFNEVNKSIAMENCMKGAKRMLKEKLGKTSHMCVYEEDIIKNTVDMYISQYKIDNYKQIIPIIESILKLKIYDFRLSIEHNTYGIVEELNGRRVMAAGVSQSVDIAKKIAELVKIMDEMVYGRKNVNLNIEKKFVTSDDIFGESEVLEDE